MNTAIQAYDPEAQRLALLEQYNPHDHILQWTAFNKQKGRSEVVNYYPANWRLYELNLKYPTAKFDIDLVLIDQERDFCIVRARLFIGESFETSPRRAVAHKQGKLTQLDRVETQAKARAARDLGISTELALDIDDGQVVGEVVASAVVVDEETSIAAQSNEAITDSAQEAPKQLPQPANVKPMKPKAKPRPAAQLEQEQGKKLLPSQFNALKSLYLRLGETPPEDLQQWTFEQAAATIQGLQGKLKQAS
jgi:hypothetical protein